MYCYQLRLVSYCKINCQLAIVNLLINNLSDEKYFFII